MSASLPLLRRMGPVELREYLQRRGPVFVKIGQFLALRPDLVPQAYCDELLRLLDVVQPVPWAQARAILRQELGDEPTEVFAFIAQRPHAAGSLAQVHLARLHDGTSVAVKVLRPGLEERIATGLQDARRVARVLERAGGAFAASPAEVVDELAGWLEQEVDLSLERTNMQRLGRLAAGSPDQRIPRPFSEYSTGRVLTAEFLHGIPVSEVLRAVRAGGASVLARVDRPFFAESLLWAALTQVFRYRFFHADMHPGNLLVLPGNVVGFVDFGLCDELDARVRERQLRYLSAVYSGDNERVFRAVSDILVPGDDTDMEAFRRDFLDETRRLEGDQRRSPSATSRDEPDPGDDVDRSPIAAYLVGLMRSARRNGLHVPPRVLSMYRSLLAVESVAAQLGTPDGLRRVGDRFFRELQQDEFVNQLSDPSTLESMVVSLVQLKRDSPAQLNQVLTDLAGGSLTLRMQTFDADTVARARNRRTRLVVSAIIAVSLSLLLANPALPEVRGVSLAWPLGVALAGVYGWIAYQWRRL